MKRSRLPKKKKFKQTGIVGLVIIPTEAIGEAFERKRRKK